MESPVPDMKTNGYERLVDTIINGGGPGANATVSGVTPPVVVVTSSRCLMIDVVAACVVV
jgi:hypothetical protein